MKECVDHLLTSSPVHNGQHDKDGENNGSQPNADSNGDDLIDSKGQFLYCHSTVLSTVDILVTGLAPATTHTHIKC